MKTAEDHAAREKAAGELIAVCRGYNAAIRAVVSASRLLWEYAHSPDRLSLVGRSMRRHSHYRPIVGDSLEAILSPSLTQECRPVLQQAMVVARIYEPERQIERVKPVVFNPRAFARTLLGGLRTDADLRYATMRAIRLHYELPLSERSVHYLGQLAEGLNVLLSSNGGRDDTIHLTLDQIEEWRRSLADTIANEGSGEERAPRQQAVRRLTECFLEACRAVGYLSVSGRPTYVQFRTTHIDSEFLISHLFGVPTNVAGLDQLFGGGGLVLPEVLGPPTTDPLGLHRQPLPARIIVVVGARGTGKSILAAQLATEIGMRGGVSWLMPLEQAPEECLFTLETMGALRAPHANVAVDFASAATALDMWHEDRGAVLILRPEDRASPASGSTRAPAETEREVLADFLATVGGTARSLSRGNVRLVVVDPLNCRVPGPGSAVDQVDLRELLRKAIQGFKKAGTNVVLVVEEQVRPFGGGQEDHGSVNELLFAENLADVIIRLSIVKRHNDATRHFEITKSRTQREQRGDHVFSIRSGKGVCLVPSVASVNARIRNRRPARPVFEARFGVDCVDEVLGRKALCRGDVIVIRGPAGSFKTRLGLPFLLAQDNGTVGLREDSISLLFSARDSVETTRDLLGRLRGSGGGTLAGAGRGDASDALRIVPFPRGHVQPGAILQTIETEVERLLLEGKSLHRIMIDNISLWESSSPEICEDATFAVTLVELLRGLRCTCLLVCGVPAEGRSSLQGSLAGLSDCLINFERYEFRGASQVTMRAHKSRGMEHRLEAFEMSLEDGRLVGRASSSLLRVSAQGGAVETIPIRLLFRTESELQRLYFEGLRDSVRAVVSPKTTLESQDRVVLTNPMLMSQLSAVDELQVLELDEFQVGRSGEAGAGNHPLLHSFAVEPTGRKRWAEYHRRFVRHCLVGSHSPIAAAKTWRAVPFFANVGLLAYDHEVVGSNDIATWEAIATRCWEWEQARKGSQGGGSDDGKVFFEHPRGSAENFNCLFFEILLSLLKVREAPRGECPIRSWLLSGCGARAAALLGILCRRAYRVGGGREDATNWEAGRHKAGGEGNEYDIFRVNSDAMVYRHWYSTLNEMFWEMSGSDIGIKKASRLRVVPLPGLVSISGEWYLGIPSYSAAPHAGMALIEAMTTAEAELTRVRLGVGLPTRSGYYASSADSRQLAVSPYFDLDAKMIGSLVEGAFSRSGFRCYERVSQILAHHLKRLVESSGGAQESFPQALANGEEMAREALKSLCVELDFVQNVDRARSSTGSAGMCEWVDVCRQRVAGRS